jgi:hypothetical protein
MIGALRDSSTTSVVENGAHKKSKSKRKKDAASDA